MIRSETKTKAWRYHLLCSSTKLSKWRVQGEGGSAADREKSNRGYQKRERRNTNWWKTSHQSGTSACSDTLKRRERRKTKKALVSGARISRRTASATTYIRSNRRKRNKKKTKKQRRKRKEEEWTTRGDIEKRWTEKQPIHNQPVVSWRRLVERPKKGWIFERAAWRKGWSARARSRPLEPRCSSVCATRSTRSWDRIRVGEGLEGE